MRLLDANTNSTKGSKMKPGGNYICAMCGKPTRVLHEIFHGRGHRKLAIQYHMQAPLCHLCHTRVHSYAPIESVPNHWKRLLCTAMRFDYEKCRLAMNNKAERGYLEQHKQCHADKLLRFLIDS